MKFLPVLDTDDLAEWVVDRGAGDGTEPVSAGVEYADAVHRFCEAVFDAADEIGEPAAGDERAKIVMELKRAAEAEERCPGVLLGYLRNGTILSWVRELRRLEEA
ncbi:MAG: hypothetical protein J5586_08220 [Clostridia bacterium]|nr:hypothetical protein [Clostridia bacterium]